MQTIKILNEDLINKIAAGEVIESPKSAVKELVENSLDAKSTNIKIEIRNAGLSYIKVDDDGCGISNQDAILAFQRHATSKIESFDDLNIVRTMGFRGEALASIAAIYKIELNTSQDLLGRRVKVEGGKLLDIQEIAKPKGTTIEISSLFYNVPVRKKFLKSTALINYEIIKAINLLALSHPEVGFELVVDGEKKLKTPPYIEKPLDAFKLRVQDLFGIEFLKNFKKIEFFSNKFKIYGFISEPSTTKKNKNGQFLIVNKRSIFSGIISNYIKDSYGTRISENEHPLFVLHFDIDPSFVDVNVHPQKKEVRFREQNFIKEIIKKAISELFLDKDLNSFEDVRLNNNLLFERPNQNFHYYEHAPKNEIQTNFKNIFSLSDILSNSFLIDNLLFIKANYIQNELDLGKDDKLVVLDLCKIYLSMLFHQIKNSDLSFNMAALIHPELIKLEMEDVLFADANHTIFLKMGFEIRVVAKNIVAIDAMSHIYNQKEIKELFLIILDDLKNSDSSYKINKIYERKLLEKLNKLSKSRDQFSKEEIIFLFNFFIKQKNFFDPLGQKVMLVYKSDDLKKTFKG